MSEALLDILHSRDGFFFGLVREHGAKRHVADAADVRDLGAVLLVDHQAFALIHLDADVLDPQPVGVRAASDSNEYDFRFEGLVLTTLGCFDFKLDKVTTGIALCDLRVGLEFDALFPEDLLRLFGNLGVHAWSANLAEELDDSDLRAEARPY